MHVKNSCKWALIGTKWIYIILRILHCFLCRAADWKLDQPDWTGRLRVCAKGKECYIKIEDKTSGKLLKFQVCNLQVGNKESDIQDYKQ